MGKIIEGLWDCKHCDTCGIGGSKRVCPNCGKPRDENTTFYMGKKKKYLSSDEAKKVSKKPDWVCNYCNQLNSDSNKQCISCGCLRGSDNKNYFENKKEKESRKSEKSESSATDTGKFSSRSSAESFGKEESQSHKKRIIFDREILKISLLILAALLILAGLIYLLVPKEKDITIDSMSWTRNIAIEEYKTVRESGWSVPPGGRTQYSQKEIHSYRDVVDHYETRTRQVSHQKIVGYKEVVSGYRDLGNGYFEETTSSTPVYETYYETETYQEPVYRSEPVYKTKYYYDIEKWVHTKNISTSGKDSEPYWGTYTLNEKEREGKKTQKYWINGHDKKRKSTEITLSFEDWISLEVGQEVKLRISLGHGTVVKKNP